MTKEHIEVQALSYFYMFKDGAALPEYVRDASAVLRAAVVGVDFIELPVGRAVRSAVVDSVHYVIYTKDLAKQKGLV